MSVEAIKRWHRVKVVKLISISGSESYDVLDPLIHPKKRQADDIAGLYSSVNTTRESGKRKPIYNHEEPKNLELAGEPTNEKIRDSTEIIRIRNNEIIALLKSFQEDDPDQQRQDLADLQKGLEEARPGQRSLFSEGVNP